MFSKKHPIIQAININKAIHMKILYSVLFLGILVSISPAHAGRGCCSHHGGESGACANGKSVCRDGTLSPSCRCYTHNFNTPAVPYNRQITPFPQKRNMQGCCSYHGGVSSSCFQGKQLCKDGTVSKSCLCDPNYQENTRQVFPRNYLNDSNHPIIENHLSLNEYSNYGGRSYDYWEQNIDKFSRAIRNQNRDNDIFSIKFSLLEDDYNQAIVYKNEKKYFVSFEVNFFNIGCNCLLNPINNIELEFDNGVIMNATLLNVRVNNNRIIFSYIPREVNSFIKNCFENKSVIIRTYEKKYNSMCYTKFFLSGFKKQAKKLYRSL